MNLFDETDEINITPLVDVFIILMTIFIALSVLYHRTDIHYEKINTPTIEVSNKSSKIKKKINYIFVYKNLDVKVNKKRYTYKEFLKKKFKFNSSNNLETVLVASENIKYKFIINIMSKLKSIGVENINLELRTKI
jgi:biopolymer transport protein ExbD